MRRFPFASRIRTASIFTFAAALLLICAVSQSYGDWSGTPNVNTPICTASGGQDDPRIISDGAGGAIITWYDNRTGTYDIYAQRINASGNVQWTANGAAICTATNNQVNPAIASDGSGGAIITWVDGRGATSDIYAQRINAAGTIQWTVNGVAISTAAGSQQYATIASDGSGGAIITWGDFRSGNYDIYAQRINASGNVQWTANGVAVSTATGSQLNPTIGSDGAGGAIITWQDVRSGTSWDIYAQRVNSSGAVQWTANGVAVSTATSDQDQPKIVSDGSGGAIITWQDYRGISYDIYAQRINASGAIQWTANGAAICAAASSQDNPTIASDGSGGVIITWRDYRSGNYDIYTQRINSSGAVQWTADGVAISTAANAQQYPTIVSDGAGGAIITWSDSRNGNFDIYAQRINASGAIQWTANGVAISTAAGSQQYPVIASDGSEGAILTWYDGRSGNDDIYAQRVDKYGNLNPNPRILSVKDVTNDQGREVRLTFQRSAEDSSTSARPIVSYGVWRKIPPGHAAQSAKGEFRAPVNDTLGTLYDFIVSVPAVQSPKYNVVASAFEDSSSSGFHRLTFLVTAHTATPAIFYISVAESGYSVDNLPPVPPANLAGNLVSGNFFLHWNPNPEDDLSGYEVFRSFKPGFNPDTMAALCSTRDTSFTDEDLAEGKIYYYALRAWDIHGNTSLKSSEIVFIAVPTSIDEPKKSTRFAVYQNHPNPSGSGTVIKYELPGTEHVDVRVYDMAGRLVATLVDEEQDAGVKLLEFNTGKLPNGVYSYRLIAGQNTSVKKMVVLR